MSTRRDAQGLVEQDAMSDPEEATRIEEAAAKAQAAAAKMDALDAAQELWKEVADDAGSEAPHDAPRPPPPPSDAGDEDPEVARALGASPPPPSGESVASASPRASPRASPSSLACVPAAQPTRHRFRAEVAHVRAYRR